MTTLTLDAEALYAELRTGLRALWRPDMCLLGVWSGGAWLAERLAADGALPGLAGPRRAAAEPALPLGARGGQSAEPGAGQGYGVISSTLHRDDFGARGLASGTDATRIPFAVDGAHILLLDDVLFTGRTTRAVLNELFDFGRPASVTLAVLVDRGGRELPIQPAYAAAKVVLPASQRLSLARRDDGRLTFSVKEGQA